VTYDVVIGVTTVAFSKNSQLIDELRGSGFDKIILNEQGRRLDREELINVLRRCDVAIVGLDIINDDILQNVPNLKAIAKYGVGLDNINFEDCRNHGVEVLHTQGVNKRSVAEIVLCNMLSLCRNIYVSSNHMKAGRWVKNGGVQLTGKTVGIIGAGNIGKELISLLKPFGCRVLVNDIIDISGFCEENGLIDASKEQIFSEADIISVHTPLTELTCNMINSETFKLMKDSSFVINTARGGIIDEESLKYALINGEIAGAALDVYVCEPPKDDELIQLPNLICSPHIGGNAAEAVWAMGIAAIENIKDFAGIQR